ncbi:MAG TPA: ATP-binding protein, partial [Polyangia bacterium]|nr:ATP-binding protein [Polyangia bacterium]
IVQELGVETVITRDRGSALAEAATRDFDVALIDVRLPDGDGLSLLGPLRARSPHLQAVMVTGNASVEGAMAAVRGAVFAYVLKPVSPPDLLDTARRALDQAALYRERERLRRELERSEQTHRELVESVPAFVLAMDATGRLTTWNSELERVTGTPRAEMLGKDGRRFVGTPGQPTDLPLRSGGKRKVRWRQAEVKGHDDRTTTYAVGIDVTDEDEILRRLLRSERLAAVGTLAAGLAHEVRNPLNSASLQLTLLERRLDRGDEPGAVLPIAHIIKSEIDRLDRLVREFLAFAQPRPLEPRPVDVGELFASVAGLIAPEAESVNVSITTDVASETPALAVMGEAERLRQVLLNLTRNAIEAMSERGGQLRLLARRAGGEVEIAVEDDGPGFGEDLPVFDAFFTTKSQGTGLGLAIVHRIVTDHGGTIRVESRPGRTRFTLALPAVPATV